MLGAGVLVAVLGAVGVTTQLQHGDVLMAIITFNVVGPLVLIAFGSVPQPRHRGAFRFINAIVMTRAERAPVDSWVHLAPTNRMRMLVLITFVWLSLGATIVTLSSLAQLTGLMPVLNGDSGVGGLILGGMISCLAAVGLWWVTALMLSRNARHGTVGRRLSGIALGRTAVAVHVPGRDLEIPWTAITRILPSRLKIGRDANVPVILFWLDPDSGVPGGRQYAPIESIAVPPDALYTALRWYLAHPESRWELGRTEGAHRLDAWHRDALG